MIHDDSRYIIYKAFNLTVFLRACFSIPSTKTCCTLRVFISQTVFYVLISGTIAIHVVSFFHFIGSHFFFSLCIFQLQLCNQTQLAPISQCVEPLFTRIAISYSLHSTDSFPNTHNFFRSVLVLVRPESHWHSTWFVTRLNYQEANAYRGCCFIFTLILLLIVDLKDGNY